MKRRSTVDHAGECLRLTENRGQVVVDVGCGSGGFVRWMRRRGADPIGVECEPRLREEAIRLDPEHAGRYLDGVGQALPLEDDRADAVTFLSSLHHVPARYMVESLREAARVARPGGLVYVCEPVPEGPAFEVGRLIDDETEVRAIAQQALDTAAATALLDLVETGRFVDQAVYTDADTFGRLAVGIDPTRAERHEQVRDLVAEAFARHGRSHELGFAFDQPKHFHLFRVPAV